MILNRTVAPTAELLSPSELRAHARVDDAAEDCLLGAYLEVATAVLDGPYGRIGRALLSQTWEAKIPPLSGRAEFRLPVVPFASLTSVSYFDGDNAEQTLSTAIFDTIADADRAFIRPAVGEAWPQMYSRRDALKITWEAGYGSTPASVPASIRQAARFLVLHYYENREPVVIGQSVSKIPDTVEALIDLERQTWAVG